MKPSPEYELGAQVALTAFKEQLLVHRVHIENDDRPNFDVIIDLLDLVLAQLPDLLGTR